MASKSFMMNSLPSSRLIPFTNSAQRQLQQQQSQQSTGVGVLPESLSGSETDVSTSNENLSHEERYVIRHTARQEPQGQENLPAQSSSQGSPNSTRSSLSLSLSAKLEGALPGGNGGANNSGSNRSSVTRPDNGGSNRSSVTRPDNGGSNRSSVTRPDNGGSNRSSLDVSSSSYNTLIIHGTLDEPWSGRLSGIRDVQDVQAGYSPYSGPVTEGSPSPSNSSNGNVNSGKDRDNEKEKAHWCTPNLREIIDLPDDILSQSQVLKHLAKDVKGYRPSVNSNSCSSATRQSPDPHGHGLSHSHHYPPSPGDGQPAEQLKQLSHEHRNSGGGGNPGDKEGTMPSADYPPPQYSEWASPPPSNRLKRGTLYPSDRLALSRSQPDLSRLREGKLMSTADIVSFGNSLDADRPPTRGLECSADERSAQVEMDMIIHENSFLKMELEACYQKVAKSIKLEQEIQKVHRAQEELVASSDRRERLERTARARLQTDCRRLQDMNRVLREQLEMITASRAASAAGAGGPTDQASIEAIKRELGKREVLIAQLITQNKELVAAKERQEIELTAQRATLQEQRTHIDILDKALTNAQGNVVRLEEECRKKQMYVERVAQLQTALASLQTASDRREQTERKLRLQLERELRIERERASGSQGGEDSGSGSGSAGGNGSVSGAETAAELKRKLREREGKIMRLEGEVAKWEQRYLEESSLRQAAIDAASLPKDAKIAALEKTSQETEKLIAEARTEKIRHMDEVHAAQKRVTDLESRLKDLESKLAERDAMIRVLQKHTFDKEAKVATSSSYPSISLGRAPHHTPHASLNTDLGVLGCTVSREELGPVSSTSVFSSVSNALANSPTFNSSNQSYASSVSDTGYHHSSTKSYAKFGGNQSFDHTKMSLDDELKELDSQLDSQLLSKRGLCCFPGFSNPSSAARKGKVSQPLLGGVGSGGHSHSHPHSHALFEAGSFLQGLVAQSRYDAAAARPEEMMLLEKQGRSSQQQRMPDALDGRSRSGSLPPSSLPRPRRAHKTSSGSRERERLLGEYGRLSDSEGTRKASAASSLNGTPDSTKGRDSLPPSPRKLGEYERLGSGDSPRKLSAGSASSGDPCKVSESPTRSFLPPPRKLSDYGRFSDGETPRKLSANSSSDGSVEHAKSRGSPARFLPPPRKLSDFGRMSDSERKIRGSVGSGTSGATTTDSGTRDSGSSENSAGSKLRLIPGPAVLRGKRSSSLQRDPAKTTHPTDSGVRSLPTANKYRIQF